MKTQFFLLLLFFVILPGTDGQKDVIKAPVKTPKKTFQCSFLMFLSGGAVNLQKTKLTCSPSKPKRQAFKDLKIVGTLGSYIVSGTINPSKIKKAEILKLPPETTTTTTTPTPAPTPPSPSPAEECDLGYTNVCLLDSTKGCREGMFKYCPKEEDGIQHTSESEKCTCLNAYLVSQAVSSGLNPLGCGEGCVCLSKDPSQCKIPADSGWGEWGSWSLCIAGKQKRTRQCNNPPPASCPGDSVEEVSCTERPSNYVPAISVDVSTWGKFLAAFNKTYEPLLQSSNQIGEREGIYNENKQKIEQHNILFEKGLVDYPLELNEFSALTYEEFVQYHTGLTNVPANRHVNNTRSFVSVSPNNLPDEFDWTNYGAVTPVKHQGFACGSCWAFSATAAVESQNYLNTKILREFSEQQMLDCTYEGVSGRDGCRGGFYDAAWNNVLEGMYLGIDYPYVARDEECKTPDAEKFQKLTGYEWVTNDADTIKANLIARGPLNVAFWASKVFSQWSWSQKPIFTATQECDPFKANHAVLLVGYGVENGVPYWRMKNSWGAWWGEGGYFRIKRGDNLCAVENYMAFPKTTGREGCSIYPGKLANGDEGNIVDEGIKSSLQACADWCQERGNCDVWQFNMVDKQCLLKSPNDGFSCPATGCSDSKIVSGTSSCGIKQFRNYGIVTAAGYAGGGASWTVEVFDPTSGQNCLFPNLPESRYRPRSEGLLICFGWSTTKTCVTLSSDGNWVTSYTFEKERDGACIWDTGSELIIMGGNGSPQTTEKITKGESVPKPGFTLLYKTLMACSIDDKITNTVHNGPN